MGRLLKTAGRAAVASSVHGRVQRRQQDRWAQQDAAPAPTVAAQTAPPASATEPTDFAAKIELLSKLGELKEAGILTEVEFEVQKARLLAS